MKHILAGDSEEGDGPNALPDQVSGVFFGWAKLGENGVFKVVLGTGLEPGSASRRITVSNLNLADSTLSLKTKNHCHFEYCISLCPLLKSTDPIPLKVSCVACDVYFPPYMIHCV